MLERDREGLRERLHSLRDYNEIKQELEIFKVFLARALRNFRY